MAKSTAAHCALMDTHGRILLIKGHYFDKELNRQQPSTLWRLPKIYHRHTPGEASTQQQLQQTLSQQLGLASADLFFGTNHSLGRRNLFALAYLSTSAELNPDSSTISEFGWFERQALTKIPSSAFVNQSIQEGILGLLTAHDLTCTFGLSRRLNSQLKLERPTVDDDLQRIAKANAPSQQPDTPSR